MSQDAVGIIHYTKPESSNPTQLYTWGVGCHLTEDNTETLTAHLKKWKPEAKMYYCLIAPVHPITSTPNAAPITAIPTEG